MISREEAEGLLSADEAVRALRFRRPDDRSRYVASHALLRLRLAAVLMREPAEIQVDVGAAGKPFLRQHPDVHFSISRSGPVGLMAVARGREVGVDVERIRCDLDWGPVARTALPAGEYERIAGLPIDEQLRAFYEAWVRFEAVLKASGIGLAASRQILDARPAADGRSAWDEQRRLYPCRALSVGDDCAAAVAARGEDWELEVVS